MRTAHPSGRIPRTLLALVGTEIALAVLALVLGLLGACGACSRGGGLHLGIALSGVIGYGALLVLGLGNSPALFGRGVLLATGIHGALGVALALERRYCLPCIGSFAVAMVLAGLTVRTLGLTAGALLRTAAPAALATLAFLAPGLVQAGERRELRREAVARATPAGEPRTTPARLDVYEAAHCSYCRDFRSDYLPRLEADFRGRLEIRFLDASQAAWVERTPTFVLGGRLLFEGLPYRYDDLAGAIRSDSPKEMIR